MASAKMFDLSGKVAIVTGGNRGIGRGLALGLAEAGAAVAILARDEEKNQATLKELQTLGVPAMARRVDLKQRRELKPAFDEVERKLGAVDIMVNNAAYATLTSVLETSEEDWDGVLTVNLSAAFLFCKYAAQSMIKRGARGKIINVTSLAADFGSAVFPSYAVTKGGLAQLTRSLAIELGARMGLDRHDGMDSHRPRVRLAAQGDDPAHSARPLRGARGAQGRGGLFGLFGLGQHDRRRSADRWWILDSLTAPRLQSA
jgi:2-deoxy-D-gluconate 3-dehydrogenase